MKVYMNSSILNIFYVLLLLTIQSANCGKKYIVETQLGNITSGKAKNGPGKTKTSGADYYGPPVHVSPYEGRETRALLAGYTLDEECVLKRDNQITVVPFIGREFKISLDLFISKYEKDAFQSVIHFSADKANKSPDKYGDRHPGLWVYEDSKLYICSALNGNANYCHASQTRLKQWIGVEISQTMINKKYIYQIKIDKKIVFTIENKKACLMKNAKVFAGDPWHSPVNGKIRNIKFESKDDFQGDCVVDFTIREAVVNKGNILKEEMVVKQDKLITVLPYIGREFKISFDLFLSTYGPAGWQNAIHFTAGGNIALYGDRIPGVFFTHGKMYICYAVNGDKNMHYVIHTPLQLKNWTNFDISQTLISNKFMYEIKINNKSVFTLENKMAILFDAVKVYAGDPWHHPIDGKIKNVFFETKDDAICSSK